MPAQSAPRAQLGAERQDHRAEKADDADEFTPHGDARDADLFEHTDQWRAAVAVDAIFAFVAGQRIEQPLRLGAGTGHLGAMFVDRARDDPCAHRVDSFERDRSSDAIGPTASSRFSRSPSRASVNRPVKRMSAPSAPSLCSKSAFATIVRRTLYYLAHGKRIRFALPLARG